MSYYEKVHINLTMFKRGIAVEIRVSGRDFYILQKLSNFALSAYFPCHSVGLSVCRSVGLSVCRSVGLSEISDKIIDIR